MKNLAEKLRLTLTHPPLNLCVIFLLSLPMSAAANETHFVDSFSIATGYSGSYNHSDTENGGVAGINGPERNGVGANFTMTFFPEIFDSTRAYIDYQSIIQDDRVFHIPGVGLRYDFNPRDDSFQPFFKVGLGYTYLDWDKSPVDTVISGQKSGQSLAVTAQAGLDYYLNKNWAIGGVIRLDTYDIGTVIVNNNAATTLNDNASLSAMLSITYRFDSPTKPLEIVPNPVVNTDLDSDGIYDSKDLCPNTLTNVPVKENGCPLDAFELDLKFEFDQYQLAELTTETTFPFVQFMNNNPDFRVLISGYTDAQGATGYNQTLSEQRAMAAKQYLITQGIDEQRISAVGKGKATPSTSMPISSDKLSESRANNRRITVTFYNPQRIQP